MPRLTVKAAAELLQLPAYEQIRILVEQKNPRQEPQVFRTPFYSPALNGIREFYRRGNDPQALAHARRGISNLKLQSRRVNNERVLQSFKRGKQAKRTLLPVPRIKVSAFIGQVEISLSLDLMAHENGVARYIYYNFRATAADAHIAKATIDIAYWILQQSAAGLPILQLEYVDFAGNMTHRMNSHRAGTIAKLKANAKMIEAIWPSL